MGKLRVQRKGFVKESFMRKNPQGGTTRVKKTRVSPSSFLIKDRGKPGRGKRVLPKLKKGTLGVKFSSPIASRRRMLIAKARAIGEQRVGGKLLATTSSTH